jgi:glycosyltransferase involved in cell wall biosynthesis
MIAPTSFFADYGCHIRILEEALVLRRLGHKVTIVTYYKGRPIADLDIIRTPPLPWRADYEVGSSRHKIAFDTFLSFTALSTALKLKPDIIHGHIHEGALIGAPIARLLGVPLVFDYQGSMTGEMVDHNFLDPGGLFYRPARGLEYLIDRLPQIILTSSTHARTMLENDFGIPSDRIQPMPDCVNADVFCPPGPDSEPARLALKQELGIPPERPVVVYLGLLAEYQGTSHLIKAAANLKNAGADVHFLVMGYPNQEFYARMARELNVADRVTLTGKIPYEHAPTYLSLGDIAIAPKLSATEGSGKVLNYMAMELPTVAFDTAVQREYLADLGVYAPPADTQALADAIQTLLDNPARRTRLGTALRQRVMEKYSWDVAGRQIVSIYDELFESSRRSKRNRRGNR